MHLLGIAHLSNREVMHLIIRLDDYRKKKKRKNEFLMVNIPIFSRITIEDGKLIGVLENGQKIVIESSEQEKER